MKKLTVTSLTLIAAALLPTFTHADNREMISASFERGLPCNLAATTTTIVTGNPTNKADPIEETVNELVSGTNDPVLASYYRDMYMAPISREAVTFVRTPDPYVDAISMALYGTVEPDSQRVC